MEKKVSRQYRWQIKQRSKGNCIICGKKAVTRDYCEFHRLKRNAMGKKYRDDKRENERKHG